MKQKKATSQQRSAAPHKAHCECPVCKYRRRGQGERTPVRTMRLPDDVWEWLKANQAASYIVEHVREVMSHPRRALHATEPRRYKEDIIKLGPCCKPLSEALHKEEVATVLVEASKGLTPGLYLIPGWKAWRNARHGVKARFCPFCGTEIEETS